MTTATVARGARNPDSLCKGVTAVRRRRVRAPIDPRVHRYARHRMSYRIKSVAAITGIASTTLRAWERRYELVSPQRTESGYRLYSEEDVARLSQVKALVDRGFKVGEAVEMVRRQAPHLPAGDVAADELARLRGELLERLLTMNRAGAAEVYDRLAAVPFDRQIEEVLLPVLREVGEEWHQERVSVAQEHFCSTFVRARMTAMLESLVAGARHRHEVICAGLPGEAHEFGLLALAVHLAMRGWRVTYLGPDLPVEELRALIASRHPDLVCSSLIMPRPGRECLRLADAFGEATRNGTKVVLGGAGVPLDIPRNPLRNIFFAPTLDDLFQIPGLSSR